MGAFEGHQSYERAVSAASASGARALDFGDKLGRWRRKCLANAVLALCRGSMYDRVRAFLLVRCCNGAGAGFGGTVREAENMHAVIDVLKREGVSVVVVSADSVVSGGEGLCGTFWELGEQGAPRLGVLLWAGQHVHVLRGNAITAALRESSERAPWYQVVAKGKRGGLTAKRAENLAKAREAKRAKAKAEEDVPDGSATPGNGSVGRSEGSEGRERSRSDVALGQDVGMHEPGAEDAEVPPSFVARAVSDGTGLSDSVGMAREESSRAGVRADGGANMFGGGSSDSFSEARTSLRDGVGGSGFGDGGGSSDEAGRGGGAEGGAAFGGGSSDDFSEARCSIGGSAAGCVLGGRSDDEFDRPPGDDGAGLGSRRRGRRRWLDEQKLVDEAVRKRFTPEIVDEERCLARVESNGRGGQCCAMGRSQFGLLAAPNVLSRLAPTSAPHEAAWRRPSRHTSGLAPTLEKFRISGTFFTSGEIVAGPRAD